MRNFSFLLLATTFSILAIYSCGPKEKSQNNTPDTIETVIESPQLQPGFVHAVYFWLKKDNPELVNEFVNEGLPLLAKVPSIQSVSWGPPAGTPRDVVDNSYDIAWIVNFANAEDQEKYQVDSLHVEFVDKYKSIFDKVQVYDNIVEHFTSK